MKWLILSVLTGLISLYAGSIKPIPEKLEVNPKKAVLGKLLFFDPRLSKDNTISCASCHDLANGGDDGRKVSFGVNGAAGELNAPTVYNAVFNFRQFWDGRAKNLKEQVPEPIVNPVEMAQHFDILIPKLQKDDLYKRSFRELYSDGITKENIADAIAAYEKTLITPNAPFDRYLKGEENAISEAAKEGYRLFKKKGCIICHNGVNVGGNLFNRFGIYRDANSSHLGRYNITKREVDRFVFKVPSLRNVALTAPYMHDGRIDTLRDAIKLMSRYQLGRFITEEEIEAIESFLQTLTGEPPTERGEKQ